MKKWQVFTAALLLALAGGFRILQQYRAAGRDALPPVHVLPSGQALPEDTTQYYIPEEFLSVPPQAGPPATYGPLPTIKNAIYDRGLCAGGSLNEILSAHGRVWGAGARYGSFSAEETRDVYGLLGRYLACVGLARRAPSYCDYLPGAEAAFGIDRFSSPNYRCRDYYMNVSLPGFAAGRDKTEASCRIFLGSHNLSQGPRVPGEEFCAAASSGMSNVCSKFASSMNEATKENCRRLLPGTKSDCAREGECLSRLAVYEALKAGDPAACPEETRGLCASFLSSSEASCSVLLVRLGSVYCEYFAKAQKRARGYAGLTPEEVKAALADHARQKAEAELHDAETKRITEEVNLKVRRMLGKQAPDKK